MRIYEMQVTFHLKFSTCLFERSGIPIQAFSRARGCFFSFVLDVLFLLLMTRCGLLTVCRHVPERMLKSAVKVQLDNE